MTCKFRFLRKTFNTPKGKDFKGKINEFRKDTIIFFLKAVEGWNMEVNLQKFPMSKSWYNLREKIHT